MSESKTLALRTAPLMAPGDVSADFPVRATGGSHAQNSLDLMLGFRRARKLGRSAWK